MLAANRSFQQSNGSLCKKEMRLLETVIPLETFRKFGNETFFLFHLKLKKILPLISKS